jgi:hypothetical protein
LLEDFGDLEDIEYVNKDAEVIRMSINFDREEVNPVIKDITIKETIRDQTGVKIGD